MVLGVCWLILMIWHPMDYNTEQVCFNQQGEVIFYASGFRPGDSPILKLTEDKWKVLSTGKIMYATCRGSWGSSKPRGREYWEATL